MKINFCFQLENVIDEAKTYQNMAVSCHSYKSGVNYSE